MTSPDFAESTRERNIKSYTELLAIAVKRRTAGQMDISEFLFKRSEKILREALLLNGSDTFQFVRNIKYLLIHGRGKNRNLRITGAASCAKTFMVKLLKLIFSDRILENPATDKYAWVEFEKEKLFLLNHFRWSKDLIPWHDMLFLLEGETAKLPAQKNIYSENIVISIDVAIFVTNKSSINNRASCSANDDKETKVMAARWKNYEFRHQISPQD